MQNLEIYTPQSQFRPLRASKLSELDLEKEILDNYNSAKDFLDDLDTELIAPNQVAQVLNTVTSILKELVKAQEMLYNQERVKAMESALIATIKTMDQSVQETFFLRYERNLGTV